MSDVVNAVNTSFKKLVLTKPYRSITVKEICEDAFISRRTFYANFVDKRAVLALLFRNDCIHPVRRVMELLSADEARALSLDILARFWMGIYDNREFYGSLVKPMRWVDPTFTRVVVRAVEKLLADIVRRYNPAADKKLVKYASTYHASALAHSLEAWIYENFETPVDVMVSNHAALLLPNLATLCHMTK